MLKSSSDAVLYVALLVHNFIDFSQSQGNEDLPTHQLIAKNGYPAEVHHVTTEDGYVLAMHRIPYGRKSGARARKPVVLIQHGLFGSSADWIVLGPRKALGYIMADLGFDVWIGNTRGNTYSRNHTTMDPNTSEDFWQFSWHEKAIYDMPAQIDYALDYTGQERLHYIGHSMGTTMSMILLSEKPEYNDKMKIVIYLAPVARLTHTTSILRLAVPFLDQIWLLSTVMGLNEFLPRDGLTEFLGEFICRKKAPFQEVCTNVLFLMAGYDSKQLDRALLPVLLGHTPAGASTRDLIHYGQVIRSGKFQKFDYGYDTNLQMYGQMEPPEYDLSKITAPISLHYSDNDLLAAPKDVQWLTPQLKNVDGVYRVPLSQFNHMDFLWAKDVYKLLYRRVIKICKKYL